MMNFYFKLNSKLTVYTVNFYHNNSRRNLINNRDIRFDNHNIYATTRSRMILNTKFIYLICKRKKSLQNLNIYFQRFKKNSIGTQCGNNFIKFKNDFKTYNKLITIFFSVKKFNRTIV